MKIFFSVGEPSGDLHGANLIRALRARQPDLEFVGYGGPLMAAAGCELHTDLTALAVMWFLRVLANLHKFLNLVSLADRYFQHHRPDAVILIDYPGFNWWIARRAKAHGIPVFYFAPPQIWAWASWRVKKMRRFVDHVLCSLPFEEPWFRERGCNATFVGHPYFDEVRQHAMDEAFCAQQRERSERLVAILPGSRTQEVEQNLGMLLKAAEIVHRAVPGVRFAVASFKPHQAAYARQLIASTKLPVEVFVRRTPELIALADCCMAVSGSVSLELLYHAKPSVVVYWINHLTDVLQKRVRKVRFITLVNLLNADEIFTEKRPAYDPASADAEPVLFPEYLTSWDRSQEIATHIIHWLTNPAQRQARVAELECLRARIAHGGATRVAAEYILDKLAGSRRPPPKPHYRPGMVLTSSGRNVPAPGPLARPR
jgi:lipid-A-disaccharide synthase